MRRILWGSILLLWTVVTVPALGEGPPQGDSHTNILNPASVHLFSSVTPLEPSLSIIGSMDCLPPRPASRMEGAPDAISMKVNIPQRPEPSAFRMVPGALPTISTLPGSPEWHRHGPTKNLWHRACLGRATVQGAGPGTGSRVVRRPAIPSWEAWAAGPGQFESQGEPCIQSLFAMNSILPFDRSPLQTNPSMAHPMNLREF